ncbi:jasmonoyl--L-amino acid synthetase JAR6 isoform X2 [Medicago truncatula]|uniref:Indole-3-acetic acid-amido synthetase n=2 Tax=Medicago truncatula TaxID=3880 RepID=A0A072TMQ6_MEDTR|nr:jasmonoyl--L-amino acid synthetase JAR6 isoform X2 [Medicago truncatula]XP_039685612.1 jasmonoyl--L-amino acid synthetase JAR6 isoform X2 [Medicago truncatula]XP_039685613.1 jasmonoyl--L-amino acid synthetase JAR6 isoform X2 [Medicago truncatula]KEH18702.1 indole-3-acetic acid-amido synthetase [Medicago truncatula]
MKEITEKFDMEKVIEEFERLTKDAENVQKETLKRILEENASAEYLQSLGLNGRTDPESFKACVPLVTYKDLEPYINRIVDGDVSPILTGKPITAISLSSGTSQGKQKCIPWNDELFETTVQIYQTSFAFRNKEFPIQNGKALSFIYSSKLSQTKGGVTAGTATANVFSHPGYRHTMQALKSPSVSPDEVIFSPDFQQTLYCHLLCGLLFREEVSLISAPFAHSLVNAFRTFEQVWEELVTDIREGVLSSRITHPFIRTAMSKLLTPNPELANLIHKKCIGLSNWYGLIPELFPNAKYLLGIMTGSMEHYLKKLRHYAGEVPLVTSEYGSSEGWIASNVNPKVAPEFATYVVLPQIAYFEFIPLKQLDGTKVELEPVGLTDVKIGEEYEVVFTNPAGLYRYKLGDVVKVIGLRNSTPEIRFIRRNNLMLTINIDKNTEVDLQLSVETASKLLAEEKIEVIDYTSYIDLSKEPGHYVIFWEISGEASDDVLDECCTCLDKSFVDLGYVSSRKVKGIGALELRLVRKGTFQKILEHYVGLGASAAQFKTPRCIGPTNTKVLQILLENVVKNYISSAYN